ncbi:MAG: hypothetical protein O3B01_23435 [Planctomycetota bacterium]|nr:hypothetical protein [Planctomycetota bacterium]
MPLDPAIRDHQTWLGYLQPDGLVVSPAALVDAQVLLETRPVQVQQRFAEQLTEVVLENEKVPAIGSLSEFVTRFLEWPENLVVGRNDEDPIPDSLKVPLREFGETLEPDLAFRNPRAGGENEEETPWLLLLQEFEAGTDLDTPIESQQTGWSASVTRRFERLLRETEVPIGLLSNQTHLRLIYAPRGENSGTLTFPVAAMSEVAGRSIVGAFEMLLSEYRILAAPSNANLSYLLKKSRDYQSRVSSALAKQVLDALYELLRGFQAADDHTHSQLLKDILAKAPNSIYEGLLTVLMRLVFLLYAEDRSLMPGSDLYVRNYSLHGLFERLRTDNEQNPDTMDHRYGA